MFFIIERNMLQKLLNIVDSTILSLTILRGQLVKAMQSNTSSKEISYRIVSILGTIAKKIVHAYLGSRYAFGLDRQFIVYDKEDYPDIDIYSGLPLKDYGKYMDVFVPIHKSVLETIAVLDSWGYYRGFKGAMNASSQYQVEKRKMPGSVIIIKHNGDVHAMVTEIFKKKGELPKDIHLYVLPNTLVIKARKQRREIILSRYVTKNGYSHVIPL